MQADDKDEFQQIPLRHRFKRAWSPEQGLDLKRHDGEPDLAELAAALSFLVDWDAPLYPDMSEAGDGHPLGAPPRLDVTNPKRFASKEQKDFHAYAFRFGANQLVKLGLGAWKSDEGGFEVFHTLKDLEG